MLFSLVLLNSFRVYIPLIGLAVLILYNLSYLKLNLRLNNILIALLK